MDESLLSGFELRLLRELEAIESRIKALEQEKAALQRQLLKARWERSELRDVNRKNSGNRVLVEQRVLEELRKTEKSLSINKLFQSASSVNYELKQSTFRTYLHRLKSKGLVENPSRGMWRLVRALET